MTPERFERLEFVLDHRQHDLYFTQSTALVLGNEPSGLSKECRALANGNFMIPQAGIVRLHSGKT
jgi:tRNA G18 (ribose-2'-O)-methylase SpoU